MKLLEEKGLRNKIINECIKKENELQEYKEFRLSLLNDTTFINEKISHLEFADKVDYARTEISDLRMELMQLLDNEKVE